MKGLYILASITGFLVLELWLGWYQAAAPVLSAGAFYLTVIYGWRLLFFPLVLAGVVMDLTLGRSFVYHAALILPGVMGLAQFWRREGNCRVLAYQMVPGGLCGLWQAGILLALESFGRERITWRLVLHNLWIAAQYTGFGVILLPVLCRIWDRIAGRLTLPRYREIQQKPAELHVS